MGHFGPKTDAPHNSESAVRIFLNFAQQRGQQVDENNINDFFQKNFFFGANGPFWAQK